MNPLALLHGYRSMLGGRQWRGFLQAMAAEFGEALQEDDLVRLMSRIGQRFADSHPLPPVAALEELQGAVNHIWAECDWGWAVFDDLSDRLSIKHACSPLQPVLGAQANWSHGFLEGAYRQWLRSAGMLSALDVRHVPGSDEDVTTFVVSRVF